MKNVFLLFISCFLPPMYGITQQWWYEIGADSTNGTFYDSRDSNLYKWVRIGNQIWMAQNLNIGKIYYIRDGEIIDSIERLCYDDIDENCKIYGGLYTDNVMTRCANREGIKSICPEGWHLPSEEEWQSLVDYLGGSKVAGGAMKEIGTTHWRNTNKGATNSSGFTALPGGCCLYDEYNFYYVELGQRGVFWSSTWSISLLYNTTDFRTICLFMNKNGIIRDRSFGMSAVSVRCIKDD